MRKRKFRGDVLYKAWKTAKWFRGKPIKLGTPLKGTRTVVRTLKALKRATRRKSIYA